MTGITGFTKGAAALSRLPDTPPGEVWRYGGGGAFQIAPRKAAFFCTIWVGGKDNIDFVNGSDLIIFDDLSNIRSDEAIPMSRNEIGESAVTVVGGFVPLGAKLTDGSPHPHAVTVTARVPPYHFRILSFGPPRAHVKRRGLDQSLPRILPQSRR